MSRLRLKAVRLVGFHNYEDLLLPVRGDLFIVGSNESGKTTLLDALHLVLSGEQGLDWNAAASLAGSRQGGRTFQGIILRADLSGRPRRKGGSISYAALELEPVDEAGSPVTLVFGASATDMQARVHRWGAVSHEPAADLALTVPDGDGSHRIIDRDEFEEAFDSAICKSMNAYRTAVGDLLFGGRGDFDRVADLWRKAKSYRELTKVARNIGQVFRQVLPDPSPEPFHKIAKGFRDISEIEETLLDLNREVSTLQALQHRLQEAREARELLRRYEYIDATWRLRDVDERREQTAKKLEWAKEQLERLDREIERLEQDEPALKRRIAALRSSESYQISVKLQETELAREEAERRVGKLSERLEKAQQRLKTAQKELKRSRTASESLLEETRTQLDELAERSKRLSPEAAGHLQDLRKLLPASVVAAIPSEQMQHEFAASKRQLQLQLDRLQQQIDAAESQRNSLRSRQNELQRKLERIERFPDLVPELPGLEDTLEQLQQRGISFELLFQKLELHRPAEPAGESANRNTGQQAAQPKSNTKKKSGANTKRSNKSTKTNKSAKAETAKRKRPLRKQGRGGSDVADGELADDLAAALETAIGIERLATIVVAPDDVEAAREIVLDAGGQLRVLDAVPVKKSKSRRSTRSATAQRLLDFLTSADNRVQAHLEAELGDVELVGEPPEEGTRSAWFARDGRAGAAGARWRSPVQGPYWISRRRREQLRQERRDEFQTKIGELDSQLNSADQQLAAAREQLQQSAGLPDAVDALQLPWRLQQSLDVVRRCDREMEDLKRSVKDLKTDLGDERAGCDSLDQTLADLRQQLEGTDADSTRQRLEDLETRQLQASEQLGSYREKRRSTQAEIERLTTNLDEIGQERLEWEGGVEGARAALRSVLDTSDVDVDDVQRLEHYVFETKRGARIKRANLPDLIQAATRSESELLNTLRGADGVMNDKLAMRYGFRFDEQQPRLDVRDRRDLPLHEILAERQQQEHEWQESLNHKTRDLFERVLARDLTDRLRSDLKMLQQTVREINEILRPLRFGHSRFQLKLTPSPDHKKLVNLLTRQSDGGVEDRDELRHFLEDRKDLLMAEGEMPPFLDYRNWFDYSFKLETVAGSRWEPLPDGNSGTTRRRNAHAQQTATGDAPTGSETAHSLGSEDMVRGSGGAQGTHHYLLLFALASLLFDKTGARLRLLMMDEAFYGLDAERKELLLRCAKQLGLDFAIATPELEGTITEEVGDSTTVLVERDENENVTVTPFQWEPRLELQDSALA